ncbi:MAG: hypothetical protein ACU836_10410 [Gammaproteobacteria bacterium]
MGPAHRVGHYSSRPFEGNGSAGAAGYWTRDAKIDPTAALLVTLDNLSPKRVTAATEGLDAWDSRLPSYLLGIANYCDSKAPLPPNR